MWRGEAREYQTQERYEWKEDFMRDSTQDDSNEVISSSEEYEILPLPHCKYTLNKKACIWNTTK